MSKILDYANDISVDRTSRIRRSISNSGYARLERGSPTFYSMKVNLPLLTKTQFKEVEAELITLGDGISFLNTTVPVGVDLTYADGTLTAIDSNGISVVDGNTSGTQVQLSNVEIGSTVKAGDYIQFSSSSKVYQIAADAAVSSGVITFDLNQGAIEDIVSPNTYNYGNDVSFKIMLGGRPNVTIVPGPGFNYYQYDTFTFQEVL